MGQYWLVLNLDKREIKRLRYGVGQKLGEALFSDAYGGLFYLLFKGLGNPAENSTWSWAGDRIIYVGDYADDYPEGVLTEDEENELKSPEYHGLYDLATQRFKNSRNRDVRYIPDPPWVVRNLSTHEYFHSDAVEIINVDPHANRVPGLMEALMIRLCWSSDPSMSMRYEARWPGIRPLYRGLWAGNRFDIVADSDFDVRVGWKDVSTVVRKEMFAIWASEFGEDTVSLWKTKNDEVQRRIDIPFPESNADVLRYILEAAAKEDIIDATAFSRVSKLVNTWMKPIIYRSVIVENNYKLASFCKALQSYPHLGLEIHRLFILADNEYTPTTSSEVILATIRRCLNIKVLITDIKMPSVPLGDKVPSVSSWPALQQIMAIPETKILPPKGHPLLQHVTHLCLDFMDWEALMALPETLSRLTHLALFSQLIYKSRDDSPFPARIAGLLQSNTSLQVLLLISRGISESPNAPLVGRQWAEIGKIKDERLFGRRGLDTEDYQAMKYGATLFDDVETKYADWRSTISTKSATIKDDEEEGDEEEGDEEDDEEDEGDNDHNDHNEEDEGARRRTKYAYH